MLHKFRLARRLSPSLHDLTFAKRGQRPGWKVNPTAQTITFGSGSGQDGPQDAVTLEKESLITRTVGYARELETIV